MAAFLAKSVIFKCIIINRNKTFAAHAQQMVETDPYATCVIWSGVCKILRN